MRWLVWIAVLVAPALADALVIEEPGMYHACPKGKQWDDVAKCLRRHGKLDVVKQRTGAKLVRLDQREGGQWVDGGIYLYVEHDGQWKIAGSFFGRGTDYELLAFEPLAIGKTAGFRIDIGQAALLHVQLDGVTMQQATRRVYQSLFCSPTTSYCAQAVKSCEVLVRGRAYWTFRGDLKINGNEISIAGDRRNAGPFCSQPERVHLGWPQ